jgi:hypothetical protein
LGEAFFALFLAAFLFLLAIFLLFLAAIRFLALIFFFARQASSLLRGTTTIRLYHVQVPLSTLGPNKCYDAVDKDAECRKSKNSHENVVENINHLSITIFAICIGDSLKVKCSA